MENNTILQARGLKKYYGKGCLLYTSQRRQFHR